jgi:acyl-CoA thioester hydrolase
MPFILARLEIDYLAQTMFDDPVEVGSRVDWIGRTSIHMSHRLTSRDQRELARSEAVLVAFDYSIEKSMPVPDAWRAAMTAFEGHPLDRPVAAA